MVDELEWQTRRDRINKRLEALNPAWKIIKYSERLALLQLVCHAVEEFPTATGAADYTLFVKGRFLGIIEAKKVKVSPPNVLEQAKRYSMGAFGGSGNWDGCRVPFLFATNGEIVWYIDVRNPKNIARQISNFHTPDALEEFFSDDTAAGYERLLDAPTDIPGLSPFQRKTVRAVEKALAKGKRAMLLSMATSTGRPFGFFADLWGNLAFEVSS